MAQVSSGRFLTTSAEGRALQFDWSVDNTNIGSNYKEIYWSLYGVGWAGGYVTCGNFKVVIDGETVYSSSTRIDVYAGTVIASGKKKIYHNDDGTRSFSASVEAGIYSYAVNCSGSGSWELPTIPRKVNITSFNVNQIDETSVLYNFTVDQPCDYAWYSTDNGATWHGLPNTNIVSGLTANTTYQFKLRVRMTTSQITTDSSTYPQSTYNYPHCIDSPDFIIGDSFTLKFYNPLGRQISVVGYAKSDGSQIFAGRTTDTKLTGFNVNDENGGMDAMYNSIPNSQSGEYKVEVASDVTPIMLRETGNTYRIRGNETPTINAFDYVDGNDAVVAVTGDNTQIVQNESILQARFHPATANYGAGGITSYILECNGISKGGYDAGTYEFGIIDSSRDVELKLTAYDSRGLSASKTITVKMVAYEMPKATVDLRRLNNYEDETYLTVDGSVSSVLGKNTMTIQYRYRLSSGSYGSFATIGDRATQTLSLDKNNIYIFNVVVTDIFGSKFDKEYRLEKGVFPLFIDTEKNSVGINKLPSKEKALELDGLLVTHARDTIQAESGQTVEIVLDLNGGANGTALVNIRIMGADLEIARLYYAFRSTQYFGIGTLITELNYNNTSASVPCAIENTVGGLKFRLTNNHTSTVTIRHSIIELC